MPTARPRPIARVAALCDSDQALRAQLVGLLTEHHGNVRVVAEALGKQRQQVYKWIKRLAIDLTEYRR
jgi:transcriptional regulator of acetoin/glycerol metabolism